MLDQRVSSPCPTFSLPPPGGFCRHRRSLARPHPARKFQLQTVLCFLQKKSFHFNRSSSAIRTDQACLTDQWKNLSQQKNLCELKRSSATGVRQTGAASNGKKASRINHPQDLEKEAFSGFVTNSFEESQGNMGWIYKIKRQMKVFTLAMMIFLDYKATQRKDKSTDEDKKEQLWQNTHERNAKRFLKAIIELEGLWVKLGQYLSTRADVLPDTYVKYLKQLQDSLPPRPLNEVYNTVTKELGKPLKEIFREFDDVPLATASISQVHRAQTEDGVDVVVKVQHKGIKDVILQDLQSTKTIVEWVAWAEPQFNFWPVINEWCAEVPNELDFNLEADNTRRVARNLGHVHAQTNCSSPLNQVDVLVPEVIQSTEQVLILQYMDGVRINDIAALDKLGVDKQALVEAITRSYAQQIYVDGFFNGDPHPGNFLVSKEPPFRPILLDFGLTKKLTTTMKRGFAKMLLACAEGDYAALLSAFAEMGLTFRIDMPEEAMEIANFFFRRAIPPKQSIEDFKMYSKQAEKSRKRLEERMKQEDNKRKRWSVHRNPVDAFPSDAIFFMRVLHLLRGLSSMLGAHVIYLELMRPFAETTLWSEQVLKSGQNLDSKRWIHNSTPLSEVEGKLHELLLELGQQKKILGIQVCAYKNGRVIIDTAAGVLGKYDPRPVQHDSLFPVFSATKGITAGLVHWLADQGKLNLRAKVSSMWPEFSVNGKEDCMVAHVLNHTAGLQKALAEQLKEDPFLMCNWDETLKQLALATPDSEPGSKQMYHALTFGWLCGGIIERSSGKKFQKLLEEVFVHNLGVEGEFYIGIPPGVEARLASVTLDTEQLEQFSPSFDLKDPSGNGIIGGPTSSAKAGAIMAEHGLASEDVVSILAAMPVLFNALFIRRAVIPAANGHFSARALARYYAMLAASGDVPLQTSFSKPSLGSHPHIPSFISEDSTKKRRQKGSKKPHENDCCDRETCDQHSETKAFQHNGDSSTPKRIFKNPQIHHAFIGLEQFNDVIQPGLFGLGFRRYVSRQASNGHPQFIAFGHAGVGGSTAFCYPEHDFALAITVNKMSQGDTTAKIVRFLCSQLDLPCPNDYLGQDEIGPDMRFESRTLTENNISQN